MNRIHSVLLFLCISCTVYAQQGISFRPDPTSALKLAESEKKLVFLYFHLPNCAPCDNLENSFTNNSISKLYNDHFVSYSLDADEEGKKMAEDYKVLSFPTLLYLTPKGEVKYSARGDRDGESIIEIGKLASLSDRGIRKAMDSKYKSNPTDTDYLYDYIEYLFVKGRTISAEKLLKAYLDQRTEIDKTIWMNLVLDYASDPTSYANKILIEEKDQFAARFGEEYINGIIWNSLLNKVEQRYTIIPLVRFERRFMEEAVTSGYDPKQDELVSFFSEYLLSSEVLSDVGLQADDQTIITEYALNAINIKGHIFKRQHLVALSLHLLTSNQKKENLIKLNEALETNFKASPHYEYLDLESVSLYRLGKEDEAIKKIIAARELALSQGVDSYKPSITLFKSLGLLK